MEAAQKAVAEAMTQQLSAAEALRQAAAAAAAAAAAVASPNMALKRNQEKSAKTTALDSLTQT